MRHYVAEVDSCSWELSRPDGGRQLRGRSGEFEVSELKILRAAAARTKDGIERDNCRR